MLCCQHQVIETLTFIKNEMNEHEEKVKKDTNCLNKKLKVNRCGGELPYERFIDRRGTSSHLTEVT